MEETESPFPTLRLRSCTNLPLAFRDPGRFEADTYDFPRDGDCDGDGEEEEGGGSASCSSLSALPSAAAAPLTAPSGSMPAHSSPEHAFRAHES